LELGTDFKLPEAAKDNKAAENTSTPENEPLSSFILEETLGRGILGVVHRARRRESRQTVALKVVHASDEELSKVPRREYDILRLLDHRYIVRALDFVASKILSVLVLEFFDGMPLGTATAPARGLPEETGRFLFTALLQAIEYLHSKGMVHSDVKPENVLVSKDLNDLRLVDFHTCQYARDLHDLLEPGTLYYAAPEVWSGECPTEANDIWSAGLCLHLMLLGSLPGGRHNGDDIGDTFPDAPTGALVPCLRGKRWRALSKPCKAALEYSLRSERALRPSATELLQVEWLYQAVDPATSRESLPCEEPEQAGTPLESLEGE
jgi:serine/threonine protein kinase